MSRLRRLVLSDSWFFITCRVLSWRGIPTASEFACWGGVIHERRAQHGFLLSAWVFLPNHGHAIFYPPDALTIFRKSRQWRGTPHGISALTLPGGEFGFDFQGAGWGFGQKFQTSTICRPGGNVSVL